VWFQGPVAAQHLADFGAEVIHVERPKSGDQGRGVRSIKALPVGDWNQYFLVINRNKKSMALDLNKPAGGDVMRRLVEKSDVFLSNLSPAALAKWQLSYPELRAINPRLVYACITGYGLEGPYRDKPAMDPIIQAVSGLMARTGEPDGPPTRVGATIGDQLPGVWAALGILAALRQRDADGRGQLVDVAMLDALLTLSWDPLVCTRTKGCPSRQW
jgi:crotonobetainyl-CoA:carnitine CoA-transferase CaiB-like acyl-CoA transferase